MDVPAKVFKDKLAEIKKVREDNQMGFKAFFSRLKEKEKRPKVIAELKNVLNNSEHFYAMSKNLSESAPEDPVFTSVELETLAKLNLDTKAWMEAVVDKQKTKADHETAAFTSTEVETKVMDLNREINYLINKAKIHKPKPKPKTEEEKVIPAKEEGGEAKEREGEEKTEEKTSAEMHSDSSTTDSPPPAEEPRKAEPGPEAAKEGHTPDDEL